jgi:hypothetical protein
VGEEVKQFTANSIVGDYRFVPEPQGYSAQPCIPFALANGKAAVRFAQAKPPPALSIIRVATEELNEKGRKLFNRARERGGKQRAKYRILLHMSVECRRQLMASGCAPNGIIKLGGHGQETIVSKYRLSNQVSYLAGDAVDLWLELPPL